MGPRHGSPKTALEVFGTIAAGGSLGGICLLAEERRRRIALAQKIIENGKRLQAHKSYQALAPLDTFDTSHAWDTHLPSASDRQRERDAQQARQAQHLPLHTDPHIQRPLLPPRKAQLSSDEWQKKPRKRKPLPSANPTTLHTASIPGDRASSWFPSTWTSSHLEEGDNTPDDQTDQSHSRPLSAVGDESSNVSSSTNHGIARADQTQDDKTGTALPKVFSDIDLPQAIEQPDSHAENGNDPLRTSASKTLEYAKELEQVVAKRIIACLETEDKKWTGRGVVELKSYFQQDRPLLTSDMERAIALASNKGCLPKRSTARTLTSLDQASLQATWLALPSKRVEPWVAIQSKIMGLLQTQTRATLEGSEILDQSTFARRIEDLVNANHSQEAFLVFKTFCETATLPLHESMRLAVCSMIRSFKSSGLFSVVARIMHECAHTLRDWRFVVDDFQWLLRYQPLAEVPQLLLDIQRLITSLALEGHDRTMALQKLEKGVKWLEKANGWQSAMPVHISLLNDSTAEDKVKLMYTTTRLLKAALNDETSKAVSEIASAGLVQNASEKSLHILHPQLFSALTSAEQQRARRLLSSTFSFSKTSNNIEDLSSPPAIPSEDAHEPRENGSAENASELAKLHAQNTLFEDCATLNSALPFSTAYNHNVQSTIAFLKSSLDAKLPHYAPSSRAGGGIATTDQPKRGPRSLLQLLNDLLAISRRYQINGVTSQLERYIATESVADHIRNRYMCMDLESLASMYDEAELPSDLPGECGRMLMHARYRDDPYSMYQSLQDGGRTLHTLPHQALLHLLSINDEAIKFKILDVLLARRGSSDADKRILDLWKSHQDLVTLRGPMALASILQVFAKIGPMTDAVQFLDTLPLDHKYHYTLVDAAHEKMLSRTWRSTKNLDLTKALFSKQCSLLGETVVKIDLFNHAILACVQANEWEAAQGLADQVESLNLEPNFETYSHQMLADGHGGAWDHVKSTFVRASKQGLFSADQSYHLDRLILEHTKQHTAEESLAFVSEVFGTNITNIAARCVADAIINEQRDDLLARWFEILGVFNPSRVFSRNAFSGMMHKVMQSAKLKYSSSIAAMSFEDIAACESASELLLLAEKDSDPRTKASRSVGDILKLRTRRDKLQQSEWGLLQDLAKSDPQQALSAYHESLRHGVPPSDLSLQLAIRATSALKKPKVEWLAIANELIADANASDFDTTAAEELLERLKLKDPQEYVSEAKATRMLENYYNGVRDRGESPQTYLVIALASNLLRQFKARPALRIMEIAEKRMQAAGARFDLQAYTTMAQAFIQLRQANGIEWCVNRILEQEITVDGIIIRTLTTNGTRKLSQLRQKQRHGSKEAIQLTEVISKLEWAVAVLRERRDAQRGRALDFARKTAKIMIDYTGKRSRAGAVDDQVSDGTDTYASLRSATAG